MTRARRVPGEGAETPVDWSEIIDCELDEYCDRLYGARPEWVTGHISVHDARYLFRRVLEARAAVVVEIGTASGLSTAFLCHALSLAEKAGLIGSEFEVVSYDLNPRFYADESKETGDAARQLLEPGLLEHVVFRSPATAIAVPHHHGQDSLTLLFLDANHAHPWPTLDLLATLDCLAPGAEVVLHDINLPLRSASFTAWGVKHLFDELDVQKDVDSGDPLPNIGSITIPADKEAFRDQLLSVLFAHSWEVDVDAKITTAALA
jgi:predicted O-methyltransferase YrrM